MPRITETRWFIEEDEDTWVLFREHPEGVHPYQIGRITMDIGRYFPPGQDISYCGFIMDVKQGFFKPTFLP